MAEGTVECSDGLLQRSRVQFRNASSVVAKLQRGGLGSNRYLYELLCFGDIVRLNDIFSSIEK